MSDILDTKIPLESQNPLEERLKVLRGLIPEAFTEDQIDFDKLRSALGDVVETQAERYGLTWAGKSEAIRAVQIPSKGTLEPMPDESVNFDESQNVIIEGDNLEVLKLLQKSYYGKVKMIYIDPPYNTGNEFIYPDNFREGLEDYLIYSGQRKDDGTRLSTDEDRAGRKHSKWLNMMYPRLFLARNLLKEDGVVFVSIDDNEVKNLRGLMDEIFGEENFVSTIIWEKKYAPQNDAKWLSDNHDFVLLYARNKETWRPNLLPRTEEANARYSNPDDDPRGPWKSADLSVKTYAKANDYPVTTPSGRTVSPPEGRCWSVSNKAFDKLVEDNRIWFGKEGSAVPSVKTFLSEVKQGITALTIWKRSEVGDTQQGRRTIRDLFGDTSVFDTPKSVGLLKKMITLSTDPNTKDIVLDFFAGSGTTGHAVIEKNRDDSGNRQYILIQIPQETSQNQGNFKSIAEICRERMRKVGSKYLPKQNSQPAIDFRSDLGFRAFQLTDSNFKVWDESSNQNEKNLVEQLDLFEFNLNNSKSLESLLHEVILKLGFPLEAKAMRLSHVGENTFEVEEGTIICLENPVQRATAQEIIKLSPRRAIFIDISFAGNDKLKTNTVLEMRNNSILFQTF